MQVPEPPRLLKIVDTTDVQAQGNSFVFDPGDAYSFSTLECDNPVGNTLFSCRISSNKGHFENIQKIIFRIDDRRIELTAEALPTQEQYLYLGDTSAEGYSIYGVPYLSSDGELTVECANAVEDGLPIIGKVVIIESITTTDGITYTDFE